VLFHPMAPLVLAAGLDKTARLFHVDDVRNVKVQGIHLHDMPIHSASFLHQGREMLFTGRRSFLYCVDVESAAVHRISTVRGRGERSWERHVSNIQGDTVALLGDSGHISFISAQSKQWMFGLKMNGSVRAASYSGDGHELYSIGDEGYVYIWDLRQRRCRHKMNDEGQVKGTAISVSRTQNTQVMLATGGESGIVNLYRDDSSMCFSSSHPAVTKCLTSLTTPIDSLVFNCSSELLCLSSSRTLDSLSICHLPSMTMISNWPTSRTPLHYVTAIDFSPNSGYLAIGNDRGRVLLYRLKHYQQM